MIWVSQSLGNIDRCFLLDSRLSHLGDRKTNRDERIAVSDPARLVRGQGPRLHRCVISSSLLPFFFSSFLLLLLFFFFFFFSSSFFSSTQRTEKSRSTYFFTTTTTMGTTIELRGRCIRGRRLVEMRWGHGRRRTPGLLLDFARDCVRQRETKGPNVIYLNCRKGIRFRHGAATEEFGAQGGVSGLCLKVVDTNHIHVRVLQPNPLLANVLSNIHIFARVL